MELLRLFSSSRNELTEVEMRSSKIRSEISNLTRKASDSKVIHSFSSFLIYIISYKH